MYKLPPVLNFNTNIQIACVLMTHIEGKSRLEFTVNDVIITECTHSYFRILSNNIDKFIMIIADMIHDIVIIHELNCLDIKRINLKKLETSCKRLKYFMNDALMSLSNTQQKIEYKNNIITQMEKDNLLEIFITQWHISAKKINDVNSDCGTR